MKIIRTLEGLLRLSGTVKKLVNFLWTTEEFSKLFYKNRKPLEALYKKGTVRAKQIENPFYSLEQVSMFFYAVEELTKLVYTVEKILEAIYTVQPFCRI